MEALSNRLLVSHVKKAKPNSHPPVVVLPYSGEDLMYKPLRKSFLGTKIFMDFGGKKFFVDCDNLNAKW